MDKAMTGGNGFRAGLRACIVVFVALGTVIAASGADAKTHHKKRHHAAAAPTIADLEKSDKYAAFVGEPGTGRVLLERRPDEQRFPASLTKMMTLYELFKEIDSGKMRLGDPLKVSGHASIQAPSKLGLKPGDRITAEEAIKAIVVVSANDVAVAIAETLGGTEHDFAVRMTADAATLGMTHTNFANASGLPDDDQLSTAHDMYNLASHLIEDFPQYYHYFSTETFRWAGRRFASHNHLVGHVDGVDGMKTGYIRASGFHLVASAKRNGHRLIAVVMGGETSRQRDAAMKRMLDTQFAALDKGGPMVAGVAPSPALLPVPKPGVVREAALEDGPYPRPKPGTGPASEDLALETGGGVLPRSSGLPAAIGALPGKAAGTEVAAAPESAVEGEGDADEESPADATASGTEPPSSSVAALLVPPAQAAVKPPAPQQIRWAVQIGAYVSAKTASSKLAAARKAEPKLLGHTNQLVLRVAVEDTAYYRARFGPLGEQEAKRACDRLEPRGFKCFTIQQPEAEMVSGAAD
jgi:D-alanyl-D-alanine carboxypeptidase